MAFENDVRVAGVVLNRVAGPRHEKVARESIESSCGIPVVGVVPKSIHGDRIIPQRHLGLVPPAETYENDDLAKRFVKLAQECLDLDVLMELASEAGELDAVHEPVSELMPVQARIGYFSDSVFTFYYPENLEALREAGAELVPVSSLADKELPRVDGLYIGGGFPETHLEGLAGNRSLMASVRRAGENGLPIFAECGGLIYLSRSLRAGESSHRMAGLLDIELTLHKNPCGHGYMEIEIDTDNPFFKRGTVLRGHEFHYSAPSQLSQSLKTAYRVTRGNGLIKGRDGIVYKNTLACYAHIHADGVPDWAPAFVALAAGYRERRATSDTSGGEINTTAESGRILTAV
jgi:cobyrinic acid a,c-diamide synthase